ncbi:hypothetical protein BT93_C1943 [Corymbia citriodora subsp. variegata]|nr:hypothetical protein BT93_C1943 [Corymbia citriodora subsp. variegata]
MANWKAGTSGDAARASGCEYDVFLNFRGEDTRHNFTAFLYNHLVDAGVHTFRDEEKLPIGDVISDRLERAINNSKLYIPIFSRNYASSKWCLRELKLIMDNVSNSGGQKTIFPIFFLVKPDDVKLKTRLDTNAPFKAAFEEHEKNSPKEVQAWKTALGMVDKRKGRVVEENTSQANIVKWVVEKVLEKLETKKVSVPQQLVGLEDQVKSLIDLLDVDHLDVRFIVIYGMGGIGKTTIAKVVFNQLYSHFGNYCSFLKDVRETSSTKEAIIQLQKKLLYDIGGLGSAKQINDSEEGMRRIGEILSNKKVLVVLDDVDKKVLIKNLIGNSKLYPGSRIIITTRDIDILQVEGSEVKIEWYEMQTMDDGLALRLFCQHAFHKGYPLDDYYELSRKVVSLLGGLPLAIEVVGSLLVDKEDKTIWEEKIVKLREVPEKDILEVLKISYVDLDIFQKKIFLDIACFFFNEKKTDAIYIWESCKFFPRGGIEVLTRRCLIKISDDDKFWMHDQLIALGRQIVYEENQDDPGKRSRLWNAEEALQIIRTEESMDMVQALEIDGLDDFIEITSEDFKRLQNLRLLRLGHGTFAGDFAKCHSKLRWISWRHPQNFSADNFYLDHLIVLKLDSSDLKDNSKAWDLIKRAQKLKVLSLTECHDITRMPDFSKCLGLERLTLTHCSKLKRIETFIGDLQLLIELEVERCMELTYFPEELGDLVNLEHFSLLGCSKLRKLPGSLGKLTSLIDLDLSHCNSLIDLPTEVGALPKLKRLLLQGCFGLRELPGSLGNLPSLTELDLSHTNIAKLPSSIEGLVKLESFLMKDARIRELPNFIGQLKSLRVLRLHLSKIGFSSPEHHVWQLPRGISMLKDLEELDLSRCNEMQGEIPDGIGELSFLRILNLEGTHICKIPRTINKLQHIQKLNLRGCHVIQWLPDLPTSLTCLLLQSKSLLSIPNLWNLTSLVELLLSDDSRKTGKSKRLSIPLKLTKLQRVCVACCPELVEIQVEGPNLERLKIERCNVLTNVEGLHKLRSLKYLKVIECTSLGRFIGASGTNIPANCFINIEGITMKRYGEEILPDASKKVQNPLHQYMVALRDCKG